LQKGGLLGADKWETQRNEKNRTIDQESKTDGREDKTNIKLRQQGKENRCEEIKENLSLLKVSVKHFSFHVDKVARQSCETSRPIYELVYFIILRLLNPLKT
jgi:hypothetical protein